MRLFLTIIVGSFVLSLLNASAAERLWYYCGTTHQFYPYTQRCAVPWRAVRPYRAVPLQGQPQNIVPPYVPPAETAQGAAQQVQQTAPAIVHPKAEQQRAQAKENNIVQARPTIETKQTVEPRRLAGSTKFMMPSDEAAFIAASQRAVAQYNTAPNDMLKGASRPARARAICEAVPNKQAVWWIGKVTKLDTNGDGKGVLYVELAPSISVATWNNDISDAVDNTLIDPASSLFAKVSHLKVGQFVRFNGDFPASDVDCVKESSLTLEGSITEPEFVLRFNSVSAIN